MEQVNYIKGGVTLQSAFDSNTLLSSPAVSNYSASIFPQLELDQSRSRLRWLLDYAGGFTYNDQLSNHNQTSQNVNFDLQYRLTEHVNVRVTEQASLTTGFFGPVNSYNGSTLGVPVGGNSFVLTPLAKTSSTVTNGDISYQFSATDVIGATGAFSHVHYRDVPVGTTLIDTQGVDAAGYYMHRITAKNWLGGSYVFNHFGYSPVVDESAVHSAIGFDTWQLRPGMTLSFFAGPQYADNRFPIATNPPQAGYSTLWTVAAGAAYSIMGPHHSMSLSYSRHIADGGGVLGTVQLNSFQGSYRQQISRRWTVSFNGFYGANDALTNAVGSSSLDSGSVGISLTRQIAERYFLQAGYAWQNQNTTNVSTLNGNAHRNTVVASFSYQFARPWGR
jgi:hypothetical protein